MIRPRPTPLQELQQALADLLIDARDSLDERAYRIFIDYLCAIVAREAARCANWENRHGGEAA